MGTLYVAQSRGLAEWGSDVGLSKHLYKVGVAETDAAAAIEALNEGEHAGQNDWRLVKAREIETTDEAAIVAHLARKEKIVDPLYYPRIRGAQGIFRIKPKDVERSLLVKKALAGEVEKIDKVTPELIADYLLDNALA
jgi:hypothetical protein